MSAYSVTKRITIDDHVLEAIKTSSNSPFFLSVFFFMFKDQQQLVEPVVVGWFYEFYVIHYIVHLIISCK